MLELSFHISFFSIIALLTNVFEAYNIENYLAEIKNWKKDARPVIDKLRTQNGIDHVIEVIEDIEKTPLDDRLYKGLILDNGMKVILVSDSKTNMSNAHVIVSSGGMNDPKEYLGLSHFLEHVLASSGSKKYPQRGYFMNYVSKRSGYYNAYTSDDYSGYFFNIPLDNFAKALDIFANAFIAPLFNATTGEKEVEAVHSEYKLHMNNDNIRMLAVYKTMCEDPSHGYCNFVVGNKESLLESARRRNATLSAEAKKLFDKHYSANLMSLVVAGPQSLEELTSLVVPLFAKVANKQLKQNIWTNPFGKKNFHGKMMQIVPIEDTNKLDVYFSFPDLTEFSKKQVLSYIDKIISFEGSGSFKESLHKDNLTRYFVNYFYPDAIGFSSYRFNFELTETGLLNVDEILLRLFSFFQTIKENYSNEKWIHEELKLTLKNKYLTKTKKQNDGLARGICRELRLGTKIRDVLIKDFQIEDEFDQKFLQYVLSFFNAENFNYVVRSKSFKGNTSNVEHYFGTEYNLLDIPASFLNKLRNVKTINVKIPQQSRFQYLSTNIAPISYQNSTVEPKVPEIIFENEMCRLWFSRDIVFSQPDAQIYFLFRFPSDQSSVRGSVLLDLYSRIMKSIIYKEMSDAARFGYAFNIRNSGNKELTVTIAGNIQKIWQVVDTFFDVLLSLNVYKNSTIPSYIFRVEKDVWLQDLKNFNVSIETMNFAAYYLSLMTKTNSMKVENNMEELNYIELDDTLRFRQKLFLKWHLESLIYGHVDQKEALSIFTNVLSKIRTKYNNKVRPLFRAEINRDREVKLAAKSNYHFEKVLPVQKQSGTLIAFQFDSSSDADIIKSQLLQQALRELFFSSLRSEQQLGYIASFSPEISPSMCIYFKFRIAGPYHPRFVESRINLFIGRITDIFYNMNATEFKMLKDGYKKRLLEKYTNAKEQAFSFWRQISNEAFDFQQRARLAHETDFVSQSDIIEFIQKIFNVSSLDHKRMSIHMRTNETVAPMLIKPVHFEKGYATDLKSLAEVNITNVEEFKRQLPLYGLRKPKMLVKPIGI